MRHAYSTYLTPTTPVRYAYKTYLPKIYEADEARSRTWVSTYIRMYVACTTLMRSRYPCQNAAIHQSTLVGGALPSLLAGKKGGQQLPSIEFLDVYIYILGTQIYRNLCNVSFSPLFFVACWTVVDALLCMYDVFFLRGSEKGFPNEVLRYDVHCCYILTAMLMLRLFFFVVKMCGAS